VAENIHAGKVGRNWDDADVLPAVLSRDTEFVFQRMTEETLWAAQSGNGHRILDVGCGRGIDAASMAKKGGVLFGCEPSCVMLRKAKEYVRNAGERVRLVSSLAEGLPFMNHTFTRVVCKGAIDHFDDPEQALLEMCRVVAAWGKVVIAVANFESLSCVLGKKVNGLSLRLLRREISRPHIWEIPADHTFKFDYPAIIGLASRHLRVEQIRGVSLLWGFPRWSKVLQAMPRALALIILRSLDKIASWHPAWSDVLIIAGKPLTKEG
jgi:ubiquinone/menaquinone biosynthesis C-methylase UbiE